MKKQPTPSAPTCCFEVIRSFKALSCPGIAQANGYCATHQYAAHLLNKARHYGCPEIEPPVNPKSKEREGLIIRQGLHNWQAYCERVTPEHAKEMEQRLDATYSSLFKRGVA